jgi:hypothetical protein
MGMRMFSDEHVARVDFCGESGGEWVLEYFLQGFEGDGGEKYYGLRIDKSTPEGVLEEREETLAITESRDEALIIANAFAKGSVPPVTLLEMADDWLSESEVKILEATY